MNATEQKAHRTVTADLQQQIEDLVTVTEALDARILMLSSDAIQEKAARKKGTYDMTRDVYVTAAEQVEMLQRFHAWGRLTDGQLGGIYQKLQQFDLRVDETQRLIGARLLRPTFWGRLKWLVTGR